MALTTLEDRTRTSIADVVKTGEKLLIPEFMTEDDAIKNIMRFKAAREEMVAVSRTFEVFPWDGAVALNKVMAEKYGWADAIPTPGFWGPEPPELVGVEIGYQKTIQVPWGRFKLPGIDGNVNSGTTEKHGRTVFQLVANVRRKWEAEIKLLFDEVQKYLDKYSIYRGEAISLDFQRLGHDGLVEPRFMRTDNIDPNGLIFSDEVRDAIETNIFTPLMRYKELKALGLPFKRGVLMAGKFGVGKTLAARVAALLATLNGITFIECPRAEDLAEAIAFGDWYGPVLIFCEDIDRETEGDRTATMDTLLNIIDGVDSKNKEIMVVLTTNAVEKINPAMIRPGRLDAVIDVQPPDAKAVVALLKLYGKDALDPNEDLTEVGKVLEGNIPAVIAEVVKRSKLAALKRMPVGGRLRITSEAMFESAATMKRQLDLLYNRPTAPHVPTLDYAIKELVAGAIADQVGAMSIEGDKLVLKQELYKFQTKGADKIKILAD